MCIRDSPIPWFEPFHQKGIKCIPVVPNVKLAQRVQAHGADALVVEGMEAGGHDGKLTLMALLENVLPDIEIPVIAAGGIAAVSYTHLFLLLIFRTVDVTAGCGKKAAGGISITLSTVQSNCTAKVSAP